MGRVYVPEPVVVSPPGLGITLLAVIRIPLPVDKVPMSPVTVISTLFPGKECESTTITNTRPEVRRRRVGRAEIILVIAASMKYSPREAFF